jgi:hypothetical protein
MSRVAQFLLVWFSLNMKKTRLLSALAAAALLCGCDKQTRLNTEKIQALSQQIVQLQQSQARQLKTMQMELATLAPSLDKTNYYYFSRSRDDALFFHTNTLFLLLTIGQKIEAQLQYADTERQTENAQARHFHTNQMTALASGVAQMTNALANQARRIEENVNAETRRAGTSLGNELANQIKLSAPDSSARIIQLQAAMTQMQRDLALIKVGMGITNMPATGP